MSEIDHIVSKISALVKPPKQELSGENKRQMIESKFPHTVKYFNIMRLLMGVCHECLEQHCDGLQRVTSTDSKLLQITSYKFDSLNRILDFNPGFSYAFLVDKSKIPLFVCQYIYREEKVKYLLIDAMTKLITDSNIDMLELVKKLSEKYKPDYIVCDTEYPQAIVKKLKFLKFEKVIASNYGDSTAALGGEFHKDRVLYSYTVTVIHDFYSFGNCELVDVSI